MQTEYSFIERDSEKNGVVRACEELGIGFVPCGSLGMGYFTGKIATTTKLDPKTGQHRGEYDSRRSADPLAAVVTSTMRTE
jgi:aryl-alcohol dehydrogenase-like predicted oxidoreductase